MKLVYRQNTSFENTIMILIPILILSTLIITIPSTIFVNAQLDSTNSLNNTLSVTGSATTNTKSDKVSVSLGVETTDKTAEKALHLNSNLMNKVINALKESGVQENETSTSSFTINPNYNYSEYGAKGNLIGFTVSNSVHITSSNINQISQWIDTAVQTGANTVNDIYFSISPNRLEEIKNSLLKEAVANAKSKADIVAAAGGLNIAGIQSITVGELGLPTVPVYSKSVAFDETSSTPILAGEQEISTTVSIVYILGR
ncbi:MAG TPA: SIMPL domain-containing protein [Nitrososphaeraceae archaeon]